MSKFKKRQLLVFVVRGYDVSQPCSKKAGLPEIRFHDLRHTAATLMLMNGIPLIVVSRRLGHSKPSVTLDIYGHYLPGMQEKAANLMDELVTPIATKWQQIGNSYEPSLIEAPEKPPYTN